MRMRQIGFTIVEVLVVIGIILIIAAITLAVYPSAKSSAKVAACKSNLHQIHTALELYKSDNEGYEKVHEFVDLPAEAMRRPYKLEPYLSGKDVFYCPICPECAKDKLVSSYIFTALPSRDSSLYNTATLQMDAWFKDENSSYPVIHCLVHDELVYYPSERNLNDALNPPFLVWMTKDGVLKAGRFPIQRGHDIARSCSKN